MTRLKALAGYAIPFLLAWGILEAAYQVGYYRGYERGFHTVASYTLCLIEHGSGDADAPVACSKSARGEHV